MISYKTVQTFKELFLESKRPLILYHNTSEEAVKNILGSGWMIQEDAKNGRLFGDGIYLSGKPNNQWGEKCLMVEVYPKNFVNSPDMVHGISTASKAVEKIGKEMFPDYHNDNEDQLRLAINKFLVSNDIDVLKTVEAGNDIYLVRDVKIMKNTKEIGNV